MTDPSLSWYYPVTLRLTMHMYTWTPKSKCTVCLCAHTLTQCLSLCHSRTKVGPARQGAGQHRGAGLSRCSQDHPSKCLLSLLWEKTDREWIRPTAPLWATDGRYTLPHCRLGPICNGMCCLIFRPFAVFPGIAGCFSISKSNNTSTLENKLTLY